MLAVGLDGFLPVEFSNGRLGASQLCSDSVVFAPVSLSTLQFQANQTPTPRHFIAVSTLLRQLR